MPTPDPPDIPATFDAIERMEAEQVADARRRAADHNDARHHGEQTDPATTYARALSQARSAWLNLDTSKET
jgi:hypothetical protein